MRDADEYTASRDAYEPVTTRQLHVEAMNREHDAWTMAQAPMIFSESMGGA